KFEKPYAISVDKNPAIKELSEITLDTLKTVHKFSNSIKKVKLIGAGAKDLASKIKDENIKATGNS
ncbi:MAG: 50S ribosomal protein L15, partial [Campylobacter sp.]|nr:50S ribosomal protein L15 [Campylobacter sp.]